MKAANFFFASLLLLFSSCLDSNVNENKGNPGVVSAEVPIDPLEHFISQVNRDERLLKELDSGETIKQSEIRKAVQLDDSSSIWLVPIDQPMLRRYLLTHATKDSILAFLSVKGAWIDNDESGFEEGFRFLEGPLISWEDVDGNGEKELAIRDRQHNGTVLNVAVKRLFRIGDHEIKYLGAFEYISHLPVEDQFLVREWMKQDQKLRVQVFLKEYLTDSAGQEVGSYTLEILEGGMKASEKVVLDSNYADVIESVGN